MNGGRFSMRDVPGFPVQDEIRRQATEMARKMIAAREMIGPCRERTNLPGILVSTACPESLHVEVSHETGVFLFEHRLAVKCELLGTNHILLSISECK